MFAWLWAGWLPLHRQILFKRDPRFEEKATAAFGIGIEITTVDATHSFRSRKYFAETLKRAIGTNVSI
jgi:hypothetical protein